MTEPTSAEGPRIRTILLLVLFVGVAVAAARRIRRRPNIEPPF